MANNSGDKINTAVVVGAGRAREALEAVRADPRAALAGVFISGGRTRELPPEGCRVFNSSLDIFKDKTIRAVCLDPAAVDADEFLENCIAERIHILFLGDPADYADGWESKRVRVAGAGLKWVIGIPALFSGGFLKWYTLLRRGQIGEARYIKIALNAFPAAAADDFEKYINGLTRESFYILSRVAGELSGPVTVERYGNPCARKWLGWNGVFGGGVYGAIEVSEPASKRVAGRLRLTARGEEGELMWESHAGRESLQFQRQEFIRTIEVAPSPPANMMARSFLDFIERGIEPFVSVEHLIGALKMGGRVAERAAGPPPERKLKVLFVNPPRFRNPGDRMYAPSLGTARMTAYMSEFGFRAEQEDLDILAAHHGINLDAINKPGIVSNCLKGEGLAPELEKLLNEIMKLTRALEYDVVGFSIVDFYQRFQLDFSLSMAWRLKRERPGMKIVFGGVADEIRPRETLSEYPGLVDFVIEGDGEAAMLELCNAVEFGDRPHRFIENLDFRSGGAFVRNRQELLPLKNRPRPTFDGVPLELYKKSLSSKVVSMMKRDGIEIDAGKAAFYLPYYNVKGCAYKCVFCGFGNFLDMQKPGKTVRELKELVGKYGTRYFMFWNTTINMNYKYCEDFCDALIEADLNILWTDSARPQYFDATLARKMARAGCILLNFGLESASDKMLGLINKGFTCVEAEAALRATHEAGILNRVNLIAGFFHETPDDVALTSGFLERNAEFVDMIGCFNGFYLNPGILLDEEKIKIKLFDRKDTISTGQETLAYDEIGGYHWSQKKEAIKYSRDTILKTIREKNIFYETAICEYDLFILYDYFRDIEKVKKYLFASAVTGCA